MPLKFLYDSLTNDIKLSLIIQSSIEQIIETNANDCKHMLKMLLFDLKPYLLSGIFFNSI